MILLRATLALLLLMPLLAVRAESGYGYPLHNPFEATIAGTPTALMPALPADKHIRQKDYSLNLRPQRAERLPGNFWPVKHFKYRLARQAGPAPLIYLIAGTGARYDAQAMEYLKKLFYGAGFHVVQLSSPTSYDFMVGASRHATPGFSPLDAAELYQLMQTIRQRHPRLNITDEHLAGYSLGALQAAFISELDSREQKIGLQRVLMLNPPVNLLTSVSNLDRMANVTLDEVTAGQSFYQSLFDRLAHFFERRGRFDVSEAMLFEFQQSRDRLDNQQLAMLIASVFRFAAADISYVADLINRRGLITPHGTRISDASSLTPYFRQALMCDFNCYLREQLLPFWQQHYQPHGSLSQLAQATSLYAIEQHLRDNPQIRVMHNADDIILGEGDLDWLHRVLGQRLRVYPHGGHLGNMTYATNAVAMLEFFHD